MKIMSIKSLAKRLVPKSIWKSAAAYRHEMQDAYSRKSYSQEGEDLILERIFLEQKKGFYVDVGAHHPKRFSNTFLFYKLGWFGINIDAMPGSMSAFESARPRDINLEVAIAE